MWHFVSRLFGAALRMDTKEQNSLGLASCLALRSFLMRPMGLRFRPRLKRLRARAIVDAPHVAFCFTSLWRCIANGHQGTKFANDFGLTELGLAELLDETHGLALQTAVETSAGTGVNDITELLGLPWQQLLWTHHMWRFVSHLFGAALRMDTKEQNLGLALQTAVETSAGTGVNDITELLGRKVEEPVKGRDMIVVPEMIGSVVGIYSGKEFNQVEIKPEMVGHLLGLAELLDETHGLALQTAVETSAGTGVNDITEHDRFRRRYLLR
jgi:ribosomal protein S19